MNKKAKKALIGSAILVIILFLITYLSLPVINVIYTGSLVFIGFVTLLIALVIWYVLGELKLEYFKTNGVKQARIVDVSDNSKRPAVITCGVGIATIFAALILSFFSQPIFRANDYHDIIGDRLTIEEFTKDFPSLNATDILSLPNIDSDLANKKATTLFGEEKGFGSKFQLGMFTDQIVDGKFVTVAPIEYNGLFKYFDNKETGTPGYVIIDKQNYTSQAGAKMVTDCNLKYLPSAYFGEDLLRHVYFSGYSHLKLTISGFELDDDLNPYWIINAYKNTIAPFGGSMVEGIILVDPQNGDTTYYELEDAPTWIDNIQDSGVVVERISQYGLYEQGYFNSLFAQNGVTQTSEGSRHIVLDGELYLFTGLTSVGADESISQVILVNKRTLESKMYNVSGATEYAAMRSAEGKLQDFRYTATFPIIVNIKNNPTYFIPLKDDLGLIKHYTFVNLKNHSTMGSGATIQEAYSDYVTTISTDTEDLETVRGIVTRINFVGDYVYMYINDKVYVMLKPEELTTYITQVNDEVELKVVGDLILSFKNLTLQNKL